MLRVKRKKFNKKPDKKNFRVNERIRAPQVAVIDETGTALGVMPIHKALAIAEERELDLVEVNPTGDTPTCKILNYGQFQYKQSRLAQQQKAHAKKVEIKGIRISYKIGAHDLEFRKNQANKFLKKGDKVKMEMILRGREKQYTTEAIQKINEFIQSLEVAVVIEEAANRQGNRLSAIIAPSKSPTLSKSSEEKNDEPINQSTN